MPKTEYISADKIVQGLIDRLMAMEKRLETLTKEINDLREQVSETSPFLVPGVGLRFGNVLVHNSESLETYIVVVNRSCLQTDINP